MEYVTLNNGVKMPILGYGVYQVTKEECERCVLDALKVGYRAIDTAQSYFNERGVGEGLLSCGLGREEIFVTSKVAAEHKSYAAAKESIDGTLEKMGLSYLDLMIIHSPQPWTEVNQSDYRYEKENREVWRALEEAYESGKVKAIGVSNFLEKDLENILETARIKPMVNQILCHAGNTPLALIDFCKKQDIVVEAYSPIAHGEALKNKVLCEMAEKYKVTVAQLCIRYDWQLDTVVLPKTTSPLRMKENAEIDFTISKEDMDLLVHLEKMKDYGEFGRFPVYGGKLEKK